MDRNLALEVVRVTEQAAIAAARVMGRGDVVLADRVAVEAMRRSFKALHIQGRVVIGEGERDQAPRLANGEKVGRADPADPELDVAVDPLEGTDLCAYGRPGCITVVAIAGRGDLLQAPDTYMEKLVVGPRGRGAIDLNLSPRQNLLAVAEKMGRYVEDLLVVVLDRPRHQGLIQQIRDAGARVKLIGDGDVEGAVSTCFESTGVDLLMGTGGAPEGVISAAAVKAMGGEMQARFRFRNPEELARAREMGITHADRLYVAEEMARGDVMFAATGVTTGDWLRGVRFYRGGFQTHSVVIRSKSGTVRYLDSLHRHPSSVSGV